MTSAGSPSGARPAKRCCSICVVSVARNGAETADQTFARSGTACWFSSTAEMTARCSNHSSIAGRRLARRAAAGSVHSASSSPCVEANMSSKTDVISAVTTSCLDEK